MPNKAKRGAVRKERPPLSRRGLKIGDRVRIVGIPADLKDPNYDLKDADHRKMRTAELFQFCLDREFTIQGFERYGHAELGSVKILAFEGSSAGIKRSGWNRSS